MKKVYKQYVEDNSGFEIMGCPYCHKILSVWPASFPGRCPGCAKRLDLSIMEAPDPPAFVGLERVLPFSGVLKAYYVSSEKSDGRGSNGDAIFDLTILPPADSLQQDAQESDGSLADDLATKVANAIQPISQEPDSQSLLSRICWAIFGGIYLLVLVLVFWLLSSF